MEAGAGLFLMSEVPLYQSKSVWASRSRAIMAPVRQCRPDSGLGFQAKDSGLDFQAKVLKTISVVPSSLGSGRRDLL